MTRVKRFSWFVGTAILAAAVLAAVPSHARAAGRACTSECVDYQGSTSQPGYFEAWWADNAHSYYLRADAKCGNGTRNTIFQTGPWRQNGDISRASCTASYPNLAGAAYDVKHCASCSITRTWVTIPLRRSE